MNAIEQVFGATSNSAAAKPTKELGQEDFLKLLVAQLKNQDPNNPADNGEFLGQIAQFSMVSGIDDLGASFEGIAASLYTNQAMQAAQLIGKDVLVETNTATLTIGKPVQGVLEFSDYAMNVNLQIHDAAGSLVNVIDLGNVNAGAQKFNWNGFDVAGNQSPSGAYVITAEGLVNGQLEAIPLQVFSKVESVSVDRTNTNVLLHLTNDESVRISQIREYR